MRCKFPTRQKMLEPEFDKGISKLKLLMLCQLSYPGRIWKTPFTQLNLLVIATYKSAQQNKSQEMELGGK